MKASREPPVDATSIADGHPVGGVVSTGLFRRAVAFHQRHEHQVRFLGRVLEHHVPRAAPRTGVYRQAAARPVPVDPAVFLRESSAIERYYRRRIVVVNLMMVALVAGTVAAFIAGAQQPDVTSAHGVALVIFSSVFWSGLAKVRDECRAASLAAIDVKLRELDE